MMKREVETVEQDDKSSEIDTVGLCGIYSELAKNFGIDMAIKMHDIYQGQQISFPIKMYTTEHVLKAIEKDYIAGLSINELARKYEYSERRVRQIIKKII